MICLPISRKYQESAFFSGGRHVLLTLHFSSDAILLRFQPFRKLLLCMTRSLIITFPEKRHIVLFRRQDVSVTPVREISESQQSLRFLIPSRSSSRGFAFLRLTPFPVMLVVTPSPVGWISPSLFPPLFLLLQDSPASQSCGVDLYGLFLSCSSSTFGKDFPPLVLDPSSFLSFWLSFILAFLPLFFSFPPLRSFPKVEGGMGGGGFGLCGGATLLGDVYIASFSSSDTSIFPPFCPL